MQNFFSNIKPAYMYSEEYIKAEAEEKAKREAEEKQNHQSDQDTILEPNAPTPTDTVVSSEDSSASTIDDNKNEEPVSTKKRVVKRNSNKTPEVQAGVKIFPFPKSLFDEVDKLIPVPEASYADKVAAFVYSLVGDDSMKDVSPFIKELALEYGYEPAIELRKLRDTVDRLSRDFDSTTRIINDIKQMNDQELYAIAFAIFHRLGFNMQPVMTPSEVNFNEDGVEDIRNKLTKDWKKQRDEKIARKFRS